MIQVQQLSRYYDDFLAVEGVSFQIGRGEIVGLLGHNGAGKSTIMKMLTGYLEPSHGQVMIDGEDVAMHLEQARMRIGYLPENCPVYPEMTVVDFLDYTATLRGISASQRPAAIRQVIKQTELAEKATTVIANLSRGFCQRVGLAQALLHNPDILILDEPTNGLDPRQIIHVRELIRRLGEHATVIVSTHILQEVEALCDRVLILRQGRLALDTRTAELRDKGLLLCCDVGPQKAYALLRKIPAIARFAFQKEEYGRFTYKIDPLGEQQDLAPAIAAEIVTAGWNLYALQGEDHSLEKTFHQIASGEVHQDVA